MLMYDSATVKELGASRSQIFKARRKNRSAEFNAHLRISKARRKHRSAGFNSLL